MNLKGVEMEKDHDMYVIINGQKHEIEDHTLTYEEIVKLAGLEPDPNNPLAVTFSLGNETGSVKLGETVKVKNGMVFDVTPTYRS